MHNSQQRTRTGRLDVVVFGNSATTKVSEGHTPVVYGWIGIFSKCHACAGRVAASVIMPSRSGIISYGTDAQSVRHTKLVMQHRSLPVIYPITENDIQDLDDSVANLGLSPEFFFQARSEAAVTEDGFVFRFRGAYGRR